MENDNEISIEVHLIIILQIVLLAMKLTGYINWKWLYVLTPILGYLAIYLLLVLISVLAVVILAIISIVKGEDE